MKVRVPAEYIKDSFLKVTSKKLSELDKIEKTTALDYFTDPEVKGPDLWDTWKENRKQLGEEAAEKGNAWNESNKNEDYRSYMESSKRLEDLTKRIEDGVEEYKKKYRLELEDLLYEDIIKARETIEFNIEETDKDIKDKQTQISTLSKMIEKKKAELGQLNQITNEDYEARSTVINELEDEMNKLLEDVKGLEKEKKTLLSLEEELGFESIEKRLISKQDKEKKGKEGEEKKDDKAKDKKEKTDEDGKTSKTPNSIKQQGVNQQPVQSIGQNNVTQPTQPTQSTTAQVGNSNLTQREGQRADNPESLQGGNSGENNPTPKQAEELEKDVFRVILDSNTGLINLSKWNSDRLSHILNYRMKSELFDRKNTYKATKDYLKAAGCKNYARYMNKGKVFRRLNPAVLEVLRKNNRLDLLTEYIDAAKKKDKNLIPFYYDIRLGNIENMDRETYIKLNRRAIRDNRRFKTNFKGTIPYLEMKTLVSKIPFLKNLPSVKEAMEALKPNPISPEPVRAATPTRAPEPARPEPTRAPTPTRAPEQEIKPFNLGNRGNTFFEEIEFQGIDEGKARANANAGANNPNEREMTKDTK